MWRKTLMAMGACVCAAAMAVAQPLFPLQSHPDDVAWPTEAWETGELTDETSALVGPLIETAMAGQRDAVMGETRAIVVIHKGRLVAEAYRDGFGPDTKQVSWSLAKSVTSALVGRAVALGLIESIDAPMPSPFGEDDPRSEITWRQWLNMTDGLDFRELGVDGLSNNDIVQMMFGRGKYDAIQYIIDEAPALHAPGTVWNYSTGAYHTIGNGLKETIGIRTRCGTAGVLHDTSMSPVTACAPSDRPLREWMDEALFDQLKMDAQPEFDQSGTYLGGSNIWASAHDFAKFGYLYLRDGVWEGERLLPKGWVNFSRTETPAENSNIYGAGWWITPYGDEPSHEQSPTTPPWDAFHAGGSEGQTIWVVPSRDLVIVRLGIMTNNLENWKALFAWNQEIARAFPEVIPD